MSSANKQSKSQGLGQQKGEVGDSALDGVSGGQGEKPYQKMDTIVVTAKRIPPSTNVVQKMDPIVVTATRLPPSGGPAQVASAAGTGKKRS